MQKEDFLPAELDLRDKITKHKLKVKNVGQDSRGIDLFELDLFVTDAV